MMPLPAAAIRRAVRIGLDEDLGEGDVTTSALFPKRVPAHASIVAQHALIVAGLSAAVQTFLAVDPALTLTVLRHDGEAAEEGEVILTIEGDGRSILRAERVALNFLQHLSGIATITHRFCEAVKDYPVSILDTRKTLPGWRALQKWAVALGGGTNHRYSLGDGVLIKDNHLALLQRGKTSVRTACQLAQRKAPKTMALIVEVETLAEVRQALAGKADIILLDNMSPDLVRKAVTLIGHRALVEVSGGITLENVRAMAAAGPDRISIGALTHSAPAANLSLVLTPVPPVRTGRA
ncbi:MAG: carboxylating nicotinate-nucleotide diphosphorylase [Nitrospira sp.]|jgi:nicotinate-nucleotide pyrophosphorylase (carboxylating)|nr:carboxylating nicotinate-nucleotide diphosphorylase [Nitrospira sp.]